MRRGSSRVDICSLSPSRTADATAYRCRVRTSCTDARTDKQWTCRMASLEQWQCDARGAKLQDELDSTSSGGAGRDWMIAQRVLDDAFSGSTNTSVSEGGKSYEGNKITKDGRLCVLQLFGDDSRQHGGWDPSKRGWYAGTPASTDGTMTLNVRQSYNIPYIDTHARFD